MSNALSFDDVLILPNFSMVKSRADVSTESKLCGINLRIPIISSNMDTVTGSNMAKTMRVAGAVGALPRFQSIEDNVKMYEASPIDTIVSIGLGVNELQRAEALMSSGATTFLIDVAHGASLEMVKQTKALRQLIGPDKSIIVGNFATGESTQDFLYHLGGNVLDHTRDAIKAGIGGGSLCLTRVVTGCGLPTLQSVIDISRITQLPVIADGGIRNSGDVAKALAVGASAVMIGQLLAGTEESSGKEVVVDGVMFKEHRGSASAESYKVQGKEATHRTPEGAATLTPYVGSALNVLQGLEAGLRSSMSYVGAFSLDEFRERAQLVTITGSGVVEGTAHGKT